MDPRDPRVLSPGQRRSNHSPLLQRLMARQTGEIINECPFGCTDEELDERGFCGHLIGFYNGGKTFEPRVRLKDGRIIVDGTKRQPMLRGYIRKKISTTARVYRKEPVKELIPPKNNAVSEVAALMDQEKKLMEFADSMRNPVLDGEWNDSPYNPVPVAAAATGKAPVG